ncbi:MAG: adenylosuccinate lyase [Prevotellaceae bacterium]|jgi:adenylosuccinate lyase|nr:adenylosuccinate lyase [Prevotellaceae bacterium]
MNLTSLTAVSPVDGRYRRQTESYAVYFSEFALMRYRVLTEVEYFIALCEIPLPQLQNIDNKVFVKLREIYQNFTPEDAQRIKKIEKTSNHDVKSVEYFLKEKFDSFQLADYKEFIHFGLTSQDINNTSIPLSLREALREVYIPQMQTLIEILRCMSADWRDVSMLAKTHGQPASPTRLGKEIMVFVSRLEKQFEVMQNIALTAKFGGATGNFNAHKVAFPSIDWRIFANKFISEKLGLVREQWTTQISNYDTLAALFDAIKRINTILLDFCRDIWTYISMDYFKQKINADETGSSAMPHKINPIDFENAEGNLGIANAFFEHLAAKLPISRLQRDLTDSTVLRNMGVPFAHTLIATQSIRKGLDKLLLNESSIYADLDNSWAVVAEGIQTILRRENYPQPYEALKALTRTNQHISEQSIYDFIENLNVAADIKAELHKITPRNYTGM